MAYVSLYRRYRPATFADIVGQAHVIRTLVHAIEEDRLHHAYLFTGPRGTGKTSTARILAKAINCEQGPTPDPCGACVSCVSITDGSSVDVIELDMASHGGVDDARELRERALIAPAASRRKVYILDEVHMASTAAFNALLKLIEEPPAHVLFAMATTDPQKVLPTILSRVQRLDLRRVSAEEVSDHVRRVCGLEGYTIEDGAVEAVVRAGDGSVRDTLSVLEQVLAYAGAAGGATDAEATDDEAGDAGEGGRDVTTAAVAAVLGQTPLERVADAVDLLGARDVAGLLALVQGLVDDGHDLRRFTLDLVGHLRDLLVLQVAPDRPDLVDATEERRGRLLAQTPVLPQATLLRAVARLAETLTEQRTGSPRLPLELALAVLATPGADGDLAELADRIARLEAGTSRPVDAEAGPASPTRTTPPFDPQVTPPSVPPVTDDLEADTRTTTSSAPTSEPARTPPAPESAGADPGPPTDAAPSATPSTDVAPAETLPTDRPSGAVPPADDPVPAPAADPVLPAADPVLPATDPALPATDAVPPAVPADDPLPAAPAADPVPPDVSPADDPPPAAPADEPSGDAPSDEPSWDASPAEPSSGASPAEPARDEGGTVDVEAMVIARWEAILGLVKDRSRRVHAVYLPATPVRVRNHILTLRYPPRYASFHAANATRGEYTQVLVAAIETSTGTRLRVDAVIEGADAPRPSPPLMTPLDARTPVLDDGPSEVEIADVREAEAEPGHAPPEAAVTDQLLAAELDAELIEHRPPPSTEDPA